MHPKLSHGFTLSLATGTLPELRGNGIARGCSLEQQEGCWAPSNSPLHTTPALSLSSSTSLTLGWTYHSPSGCMPVKGSGFCQLSKAFACFRHYKGKATFRQNTVSVCVPHLHFLTVAQSQVQALLLPPGLLFGLCKWKLGCHRTFCDGGNSSFPSSLASLVHLLQWLLLGECSLCLKISPCLSTPGNTTVSSFAHYTNYTSLLEDLASFHHLWQCQSNRTVASVAGKVTRLLPLGHTGIQEPCRWQPHWDRGHPWVPLWSWVPAVMLLSVQNILWIKSCELFTIFACGDSPRKFPITPLEEKKHCKCS